MRAAHRNPAGPEDAENTQGASEDSTRDPPGRLRGGQKNRGRMAVRGDYLATRLGGARVTWTHSSSPV